MCLKASNTRRLSPGVTFTHLFQCKYANINSNSPQVRNLRRKQARLFVVSTSAKPTAIADYDCCTVVVAAAAVVSAPADVVDVNESLIQ